MKLILGTAQLGLTYGITNSTGKLSDDDALSLLNECLLNGITMFDTAREYGSAEELLGKLNCDSGVIITKLSHLGGYKLMTCEEIHESVVNSVQQSLHSLQRDSIDVLLLHNIDHYSYMDGIVWNTLIDLKLKGVIKSLGVSIYNISDLLDVINDCNVETIQIPFNILSSKWLSSSVQKAIADRRRISPIKIYCRSIFLQGILISDHTKWPKLPEINTESYTQRLDDLTKQFNFDTKIELVISYVKSMNWIDGIIFGVDNINQLHFNLNLFSVRELTKDELIIINNTFTDVPDILINPSLWNIK